MTIKLNAAARLSATAIQDEPFLIEAAVAIVDGIDFDAPLRKHLLAEVEALGRELMQKANPSLWHNSDAGTNLAKFKKLVLVARQLYKELTIATDKEELLHALQVADKLVSVDGATKICIDKLIKELG